MTNLFLKYRNTRRKLTHHAKRLVVAEDGLKWKEE
jgi:hypothetical protein